MQYIYILLLIKTTVFSIEKKDTVSDTMMFYGDTINILNDVTLFPEKDKRASFILNYRIKKRILKVWEYAIMTQDELERLEKTIVKLDKSQKKEYIKVTEIFIRKNFEETLKNFYIEDGQVLLKLIYRQTGKTAYETVKSFRSSWTAFWWNSTAFFFELSLRSEYHPEVDYEDFLIEKNLQELFDKNKIEMREPKIIN